MANHEKLSIKSNYSLVRVGNIIILQWVGVPTEDALQPIEKAFELVELAHKDKKIGFLTIMEESMMSQPIPPSVRNGIDSILQKFDKSMGARSTIYEGTGMKATVVRTMLSTVNLIARTNFPSRVDESLSAGLNWFVETMGPHTTLRPAQLVDLIKELRAQRSAA